MLITNPNTVIAQDIVNSKNEDIAKTIEKFQAGLQEIGYYIPEKVHDSETSSTFNLLNYYAEGRGILERIRQLQEQIDNPTGPPTRALTQLKDILAKTTNPKRLERIEKTIQSNIEELEKAKKLEGQPRPELEREIRALEARLREIREILENPLRLVNYGTLKSLERNPVGLAVDILEPFVGYTNKNLTHFQQAKLFHTVKSYFSKSQVILKPKLHQLIFNSPPSQSRIIQQQNAFRIVILTNPELQVALDHALVQIKEATQKSGQEIQNTAAISQHTFGPSNMYVQFFVSELTGMDSKQITLDQVFSLLFKAAPRFKQVDTAPLKQLLLEVLPRLDISEDLYVPEICRILAASAVAVEYIVDPERNFGKALETLASQKQLTADEVIRSLELNSKDNRYTWESPNFEIHVPTQTSLDTPIASQEYAPKGYIPHSAEESQYVR
ncbi:MAG: hypothetical protein LBJ92_04895 [Holosporales bacterium]|jgi:hypothetical protein|nr:hypothetical protein [Holosporales bacterium]